MMKFININIVGVPHKIYIVGCVSCFKIKTKYTLVIGEKTSPFMRMIDEIFEIKFRKLVTTHPGKVTRKSDNIRLNSSEVHLLLREKKFHKDFENKLK